MITLAAFGYSTIKANMYINMLKLLFLKIEILCSEERRHLIRLVVGTWLDVQPQHFKKSTKSLYERVGTKSTILSYFSILWRRQSKVTDENARSLREHSPICNNRGGVLIMIPIIFYLPGSYDFTLPVGPEPQLSQEVCEKHAGTLKRAWALLSFMEVMRRIQMIKVSDLVLHDF